MLLAFYPPFQCTESSQHERRSDVLFPGTLIDSLRVSCPLYLKRLFHLLNNSKDVSTSEKYSVASSLRDSVGKSQAHDRILSVHSQCCERDCDIQQEVSGGWHNESLAACQRHAGTKKLHQSESNFKRAMFHGASRYNPHNP